VPWEGLADAAQRVQVIGATILVLGLVAWVISILATVLTYGGFELRQAGSQLHLQYGVLDKRRVTIPVRRIQAIRISETLMRQPFGYASISFDLAGQGAESGDRGVLFPILPRREVHALLEDACPDFAIDVDAVPLQRLPGRARRRYVFAASVGWVMLVVIVAVVAWQFLDVPAWWAPSALALTPIFALFGMLRYRDAGWAMPDARFVMRYRTVARVTAITQVRRLQFRELKADPFQRRANLVTFRTAVASGGVTEGFSLAHLDREVAEGLARQLGRSPRVAPPAGERAGTSRTA
jgi:putative membrane protein